MKKTFKKLIDFSLSSIMRSENQSIVSSIFKQLQYQVFQQFLEITEKLFKSLEKYFCLHCSHEQVEKSSQENFKLIKNTLPNKSGNPKSFKNDHSSCKTFQLAWLQLLYFNLVISEKVLRSKIKYFTGNLRKIFI